MGKRSMRSSKTSLIQSNKGNCWGNYQDPRAINIEVSHGYVVSLMDGRAVKAYMIPKGSYPCHHWAQRQGPGGGERRNLIEVFLKIFSTPAHGLLKQLGGGYEEV